MPGGVAAFVLPISQVFQLRDGVAVCFACASLDRGLPHFSLDRGLPHFSLDRGLPHFTAHHQDIDSPLV
jgi:hypothetical protein